MYCILGPTWAYEHCDKLATLGHASVGVGHCVERQATKVGHEIQSQVMAAKHCFTNSKNTSEHKSESKIVTES